MSIIALSCPKCGGSLQIDEFSTKAKCPYCGTESIVHNDGSGAIELEYHARCPRCNRNDQVRALTALCREGNTLSDQLAAPKKPKLKSVPKELSTMDLEMKDVAIHSVSYLIFGVMTIIGLWGFGMFFGIPGKSVGGGIVFLLIYIVYLLLYFKARKDSDASHQSGMDNTISKRKENIAVLTEENRIKTNLWEKKMDVWRRLYYCSRDDCVFLPNIDKAAPPNSLSKLIDDLIQEE